MDHRLQMPYADCGTDLESHHRNVAAMDVFDFNFIVLPLGVMVFVLVAVVLFVVKRKEIEQEQKVRQIAS